MRWLRGIHCNIPIKKKIEKEKPGFFPQRKKKRGMRWLPRLQPREFSWGSYILSLTLGMMNIKAGRAVRGGFNPLASFPRSPEGLPSDQYFFMRARKGCTGYKPWVHQGTVLSPLSSHFFSLLSLTLSFFFPPLQLSTPASPLFLLSPSTCRRNHEYH